MKIKVKILIYSLVIVLSLTGAYYCGLFTRYNFVTAYFDIFSKTYQISEYGEMDLFEIQKKVIAPDLGFRIIRSYGCNVHPGITNGVDGYNKIMGNYIENNVCRHWKIKLENGSRLLYKQDSLAESIIDKYDFKKTRRDIPQLTNIQLSIDRRSAQFYQFSGYGYVDSIQKSYKFFEAIVNLKDRSLKIRNYHTQIQ